MNWLIHKLGESTVTGYLFRVLCIVIGVVVLSLFWAYDSANQMFCFHADIYPLDDEHIMCGKCGKEIWSPWAFK